MDELFRKHRPQRFEDIVDQPQAVAFLSGLIRSGPVGKNIVLYGPPGTGKTTLARIYAKALSCTAPTKTGSPCLACTYCQGFKPGWNGDYAEINGAVESSRKQAKGTLEWASLRPEPGRRFRVLFIDEAQGMDRAAFDVFLKLAEEPPPHLVLILGTSDTGGLPESIRTRFLGLHVVRLSTGGATELLSRVADLEGIIIDAQAIELLVELARGSARELLQGLERVAFLNSGKIAATDVARAFQLGEMEPMLRYFEALANANVERQVEAWSAWNEAPSWKWPRVQNFLLYLFYTEINEPRMEITIDPLFTTVPIHQRAAIAARLSTRSTSAGSSRQQSWLDLMALATGTVDLENERAIEVRVTLLHAKINMPSQFQVPQEGSPFPVRPQSGNFGVNDEGEHEQRRSDNAAPALVSERKRQARRRIRKGPRSDDDASSYAQAGDLTFLSSDDARRLITAASFLAQEYGKLLNTTVLVSHKRLGNPDDAVEAAALISDLVKAIGRRYIGMIDELHWIYVHDYDNEHGLHTRIALSAPKSSRVKVRARLFNFIAGRYPAAPANAMAVGGGHQGLRVKERLIERHWICLRHLLVGIDPAYEVEDEAGQPAKLHKMLGVEAEHRPNLVNPLPARRLEFSRAIGASARRRVEVDEALPCLSAFDDWAWSFLATGWELSEAQERRREREERANERRRLEALHTKHGIVDEEALSRRLKQWRASWPQRARDRRRAWLIWPEH